MRILTVLTVLAALVGGIAVTVPASADCRTTCMDHAGGQQTCTTHCW